MKLTKQRIGDYIKDVASGPFGSNLKVECFVPSGFPIIDGANLTGLRVSDNITKFVTEEKARSLSRSIAKRRDVIVTISGTLGQVSYIPDDSKYEEYLCSQRQFRVTFDESKVNVEYLVNLLRTPYGQRKILAFANYVGVPALAQPIPNFKNVELHLPDLPTQLRIAGVLGSLDEKIALNRKKIAELEALAKTIYDYWFVQFDFPDKDGKPYKSSGGKMVWNEQLKREIPEGWEVGTLSDIVTITMGQSPNGSRLNESGDGTLFFQGSSDFGDVVPSNRVYTLSPTRMAYAGDVLLSVRAPVGATNIALLPCCIGRGLAALRGTDCSNIFILQTLSLVKSRFAAKNVDGTTFGSLSKDELCGLEILKPPVVTIHAFDDLANPIMEQVLGLVRSIRETSSLRDILLPLLMNGQVVVK